MSKREKKVKPTTDWEVLLALIGEYRDHAIADAEKGGGDPADMDIIELEYKLAQAKLLSHIEKMQRERDEQPSK